MLGTSFQLSPNGTLKIWLNWNWTTTRPTSSWSLWDCLMGGPTNLQGALVCVGNTLFLRRGWKVKGSLVPSSSWEVNLRPIRENSRRPDICIRGRWPFSMGPVRIVHGNRTYVSASLPSARWQLRAWVVAQFQVHRAQAEGLQVIAEEILWNHFATVFRDAAFSRPDIMATNACQNFTNRVYSCLLASAAARSGLQKSISVDEKQERENSQRKGRENLPRTAPIGAHKQPADQSQELRRNGENQPATRTQEPGPPMVLQPMPSDHPKVIGPSPLEKGPSRKPCSPSSVDKDGVVVDHLDKQPTTRTSEPGPPMCLQAMPSDHPKVIGPSPRENSPGPLLCFPGSVSNLQVGLENEKGGELLVAKQMHRELFQKQSKQKGTHSSRDDAGKIHEPNGTKAKHWSDPGSSSTCVGGGMQLLPQELPLAHRSLCQVSPGRWPKWRNQCRDPKSDAVEQHVAGDIPTQELAQAAVLAEADQASDAPEKGKNTQYSSS